MTCPGCGLHIQSTQQTWQERQRALGRCIVCGVETDIRDEGKFAGQHYTRCFKHRVSDAARSTKAYHRRTKAAMQAGRVVGRVHR